MDDLQLWREFRRFRINDHRGCGHGGERRGGRGYFLVLECLTEGEGKTQREIADAVEIRAQSLSEALTGMEEQGLIERIADARDRRAVRVFITPKGLDFRAEREKELRARAEDAFRSLTEEEKATLFRILRKMHAARRSEE